MRKNYKFLSLVVAVLVTQMVFAQYNAGVVIANEGNYGQSNASVSYYDPATHQVSNGIYASANDNEAVGDVLQHVGFHENKAYLVVNNSNKVIVVNRASFVKEAEVTEGISVPRYIAFAADKFFVTNTGDSTVGVYNVSDNSFVSSISLGGSMDNLVAVGDKVYVMQAAWGTGNSVAVIDANDLSVSSTITLADGLQRITADEDYVYAVCGSGDSHSAFFKIDAATDSVISTFTTDDYTAGSKMAVDSDFVYTISGNNIYAFGVDATAFPADPVITVTDNSWSTLYGFGVGQGFVLTSDAMGFTEASSITAYLASSYTPIGTLSGGMGTNGFYLNSYQMGVEEVNVAEFAVSVYPNPAQDFVNFEGVESAEVKFVSVQGKVVKTAKYEGSPLRISDLAKGVYLVLVSSEKGLNSTQLIVK